LGYASGVPRACIDGPSTVERSSNRHLIIRKNCVKQYVIAARSLGYTWRSIRNVYALRNVIAPVIVMIAGLVRLLVGEQVLVEWLFHWPGLGRLLAWTLVPAQLSSTQGSPLFLNPPVMATVLTLIAILFLVSDLIGAILVRIFDHAYRSWKLKPVGI
jgi:ABC-type dipeptide/oligopeptide/nickel transport system permease component